MNEVQIMISNETIINSIQEYNWTTYAEAEYSGIGIEFSLFDSLN